MADVTLDSLVGEHVLDAVDTYVEKVKTYEWCDDLDDANCIRFRLDGIVYTAVEDPNDGYRSHLGKLFVSPNDEVRNVFPPCRVLVRKKPDGKYGDTNDTLEMIDVGTGKTVMEVGTDNSDEYYPSFVSAFCPEHMAVNQDHD